MSAPTYLREGIRGGACASCHASRGFIDDVIDPRETRVKIIRALEMLQNKTDTNPPKKHGNIPL